MGHHFNTIALDWLMNVAFGAIALVVALCTIRACDLIMFRRIDFISEIKDGNIAASVAFSAMLAFAAYIIGASVR